MLIATKERKENPIDFAHLHNRTLPFCPPLIGLGFLFYFGLLFKLLLLTIKKFSFTL